MGRPKRTAAGGVIYHVLNRANAGMTIFEEDDDYEAFERVLLEAAQRYDMRLLAFQVMPNHWHQVLWSREDGDLSRYTGWLTLTHTQRWHAHRRSTGSGHLYQGRFKSFPIEDDEHFLTVCRYVERNALRAGLVHRAEDWRWGSLWRYVHGTPDQKDLLAPWPVHRARRWIDYVNEPQTEAEVAAIRRSIERGRPFGSDEWTRQIVCRHGLEITERPRGRPRRTIKGS